MLAPELDCKVACTMSVVDVWGIIRCKLFFPNKHALESIQLLAAKMIPGLREPSFEGRRSKLSTFSTAYHLVRGGLVLLYTILRLNYTTSANHFLVILYKQTRSSCPTTTANI